MKRQPKNHSIIRLTASATLSLITLFSCISFNAYSHHSFRVHFNPGDSIQISGILKNVRLRNPHSFLNVDVENDKGEIESWRIETHSIPLLNRVGMTRDVFTLNSPITIMGMPSRVEGRHLMFGLVFILENGKRFEWRPDTLVPEGGLSAAELSDLIGPERLAGVWGYETDPNPHVNADSPLPLNQAGLDARAKFNPLDTPAMRCIPPNMPTMLYVPYLNGIEIENNTVVFKHEYFNITRRIPISGNAVQAEPSGMFGIAKASFDNNTLTIESSGYPDLLAGMASDFDPNGVGADVPSSKQKKFTERYRLSADGNTLNIDYTIEDPVYLTKVYNGHTQMKRLSADTVIEPFECDFEMASQSTSQQD